MLFGFQRCLFGHLVAASLFATMVVPGSGDLAFAARLHFEGTGPHLSLSAVIHPALEPYGRWTTHQKWGDVWIPSNIPSNWRPYEFGKWVYSDQWGWYWASDEDWGWITYHYGRWAYDPELGWMWIPGDEWGPAWVEWRRGPTRVGWCPLPPDELIDEVDTNPNYWTFVETQDLLSPQIDSVALPFGNSVGFIRDTEVVNETVVVQNKDIVVAANPGISPALIAAAIHRPVQIFAIRPRVLPVYRALGV